MEAILNKLANSSESKLVDGLVGAIQAAKDELARKGNVPNHEIRQKLLDVFGKVFKSGKSKLTFTAMDGLQTILRDSSFYSDKDGCRVIDSLSAQVLRCLNPVPTWSSQIQCQIFTVLVQLISSNEFQISMADVFGAIQICFKAYLSSEDPGVKLAIRAALTQMLNSFCLNRQLRAAEVNAQEEVAMLMDMTTLLNEVLPRLDCTASEKNTPDELQLALDAMYSIISVQPPFFYRHAPLLNLFKSEIIPALICLLQVCDDGEVPTPSTVSKSKLAIVKQLNFRSSNGTTNAKSMGRPNVFATPEVARSFYQVVEQILQLFSGRKDEEKLILELYRTSILVLPSTKRLEALKLIKRMVLTPPRLTVFLTNLRDEPLYWLIPMECLEECSKCLNPEICVEALNCLNALLSAFLGFVTKMDLSKFSNEFLQKIDEEFIERKGSNQSIQFFKRCDSREFTQAARNFVEKFRKHILEWAALDDLKLIDDKILQFSIEVSRENLSVRETTNVNANVLYLTTYTALDLCVRIRYHQQTDEFESWVTKILVSGTNSNELCVDKEWLLQVYQLLTGDSSTFENVAKCCALERLVDDYDGFANGSLFVQKDSEEKSSSESDKYIDESKRKVEKWIQNILASCWSSILVILTRFSLKDSKKTIFMTILPPVNVIGVVIAPTSSNNTANNEKMLVEGTKATLECMRSLLTLLIRFSMHKEMSWIYEKLGEEICQLEDLRQLTSAASQSGATTLKKPWLLLNRNDAFAISMMMENAIQHTTLPNGVWKYVVRCIEYISELERYLFQTRKQQVYDPNTGASGSESCEMILEYPHNELSASEVSKVLDELLMKIDIFFEKSPKNLNLSSICTLLTTLIATNEDNLKYSGEMSAASFSRITSCVLLQRISQLVCGVQDRNFIHIIKTWNCVKDHFTEAAFAKFPDEVTKMSICCIHDCLKALLVDEKLNEKWRFNFNGTLFNIFQTILCSDVAKVETQEHIVSILGTFMEENGDKIGTGWKPLFGTLKAVHVSGNKAIAVRRSTSDSLDNSSTDKQTTLKVSPVNAAVLDVFKKFLKLKNDEVIYLALLDYIHCVTNYLRSVAMSSSNSEIEKTEDELEMEKFTQKTISLAVCTFLQDIQEFLFRIFEDSTDIPVNSALLNSLEGMEEQNSSERNSESRLKFLLDLSRILPESSTLGLLPSQLNDLQKCIPNLNPPWHGVSDYRKCIFALFLSLVEDLCGLLDSASQQIHSQIVTTLADLILRFKSTKIGLEFGVFSLCENVFASLRNWMQKSPPGFVPVGNLPTETRNLKQSAGIFTQVVVDYIVEFPAEPCCEKLLNEVLELFNEFISHSSQFISGIGCSCLKHLLFSAQAQFSPQMWSRTALNLWKTICFTLFPVRALIAQFFANSKEFCGDMGEMSLKLKDENTHCQTDNSELQVMAKQIFLISQRDVDIKSTKKSTSNTNPNSEGRPSAQFAYVFTFKGAADKASNSEKMSFSLDELITSLFNHQTIIQIICQLLTGESNALLNSGVLTDESDISGCVLRNTQKGICELDAFAKAKEEGRITLATLIFCVQASALVAEQFDERPALKFLLQKLCHLEDFGGGSGGETSTNLYKVLVACKSVEMWTLLRLSTTSFCDVSEEAYWMTLDSIIDDVFASLEKAEKNAAAYKLAAFAREKFCKPVEYALAECQSSVEAVKTFKVVKNTDYLKEYHRQKMAEVLPKVPHSENNIPPENKVSESGTIVNPFLHAQPSSTNVSTTDSNGACDEKNFDNQMGQHGDLELSKFNNLDICILAHSEILAILIEKISSYTDSQTFKKILPRIFPKIQRFLLLTGNSRARSVVANFLNRIQMELLENN